MRWTQEGSDAVLRFVLAADDGALAAVELRGSEIRGVLDDGDRVTLATSPPAPAGGLHRPNAVRNLTTGSIVTASHPSLRKRVSLSLGQMVATAVVSALVTAASGSLFGAGGGAAPGGDQGGGSSGSGAGAAALALVAVALLGGGAIRVRRLRARGRRSWPAAVAFGVAGGWLFGLALLVAIG